MSEYCKINDKLVTRSGYETLEDYLTRVKNLLLIEYPSLQEEFVTGETKPKWTNEICGTRANFDTLAKGELNPTRHIVTCSNTKGHKTQHWATIEGERVNWE